MAKVEGALDATTTEGAKGTTALHFLAPSRHPPSRSHTAREIGMPATNVSVLNAFHPSSHNLPRLRACTTVEKRLSLNGLSPANDSSAVRLGHHTVRLAVLIVEIDHAHAGCHESAIRIQWNGCNTPQHLRCLCHRSILKAAVFPVWTPLPPICERRREC